MNYIDSAGTRLRQGGRLVVLSLLLITLLTTPVLPGDQPSSALAQGGGRQVQVGDRVTGTLNSDTFVQGYTLSASAGDTISVNLTTEEAELAPTIIVLGPSGAQVAQDADLETPTTAALTDIALPASGVYTILVTRGSGAEGDASGTFTMQITGIQQIGGQTVNLANSGLLFELAWSSAVDLNLEVRDPVGGTVHAFSPGSPSGGTLDADVNGNCAAAISDNPTETITWPAGEIPAGSYEVIIYYIDGCDVGGPQVFTLTTNVNAGTPESLNGTLNPGQNYLARLVVAPDGTWTLNNGGVNAGLNIALVNNEILNADPVALGSTVVDVITNARPAQAYTFSATAGTTVNLTLTALSGSLDTYLVLLGPDNTPLASNDDASDETTNSALERTLAVDGTYTAVATRFGLSIGGTEGEFSLSLTTVGTDVAEAPTEIAPGDATTPPTGTDTTTDDPLAEAEGIVLPDGSIDITLQWTTNADLQLLVRDPIGAAVYDDIPEISSGGILFEDGNVGCVETTTNPVSYIYWPQNRLPPGTYEIEVWYQNTCDDTTPVNFGLTVDVQGETIINTSQPASPNSRYMITFKVEPDGTVTAGPGGFFDMENPATLNYTTQFASAIPVTYGASVTGSITEQQRFVLYSFEGEQGDIVTIGMNASSGTLDPALYLITEDDVRVAFNDDVVPGENPNSVIEEAVLPITGTYYIIATHYGLDVGGTQGTYILDIAQQ